MTLPSKFNFQKTFNDADTFSVVIDTSGSLVAIHNSSLFMAGLKEEDVLGRYIWDCFWFNHDEEVQISIQKACENTLLGQIISSEVLVQMRDKLVWLDVRMHPIFDDQGNLTHLAAKGRNIDERKKAAEKLRDSERQSRAWLENSPVCTKIVDLDFRLQYMSSAGIRELQIDDITEYYGKTYPLSFYPDSFKIPMTNNLVKVKETGKIIIQEAFVKDTKGNKLWYQSTIVPVKNEKDQIDYFMVVSMNITEKKQAEKSLKHTIDTMEAQIKKRTSELAKSEERFSFAMQGANDGLWDWNLETNEVYFSPRWKSMLGYKENELDDALETWASLVHPDDKNWVLEKVHDFLKGQADLFEVEMRMQHKDGHVVFVLSRGFCVNQEPDEKPIRLVGTHVDITERKIAEKFNSKNAEILEMIATGIPVAKVYDEIALMYEERHPGLRCSMLELHDGKLMHGGAPSLPKEYCDAIHGLKNGPGVGSCGTSTYTGKRVLVENIETDPKWDKIKQVALPHGMRCCWSEPIKNSSGKVLGAFGMYYNHPALPDEEESFDLKSAARLAGIVMEREQNLKRIRELAFNDELTGLSSRAHFYQNLEELIKVSNRHHRRFGLLYIDLDNFKDVNDSLGHDAGDLLLREIAKRLEFVCRENDFVARLGGDEFCIITKDVDDDYSAVHVAQRCLDSIAKPIELLGRKFKPACSVGIAHYPDDGKDLSTLLKAADTSLYAAKEHGKNQYAFYNQELTQKAEYRFQVEQYLREAIEKNQLSLVYQPQVKINTGEIIGVEALSRWHDSRLGHITPTEFIPIAERIGMIKPLTEWVLRTACNQAVTWKNAGFPVLRMAVNISPKHFLDIDFVSLIKRIIDETGMDPTQLELEVTESVVQTDEQNLMVFRDLKALGVLLAIDDFGTGYSSFASLKHLTADCLKIDKYFINDILTDKDAQLLIRSMIEIGHNLEQGIIAEGIESTKQLNALQKLECETAQGFLFSKPVSADEVSMFLNSNIENGRSIWPYPITP
ncbi:MAG: EAL domain-containing protein [Gammaproteobacteria bacterium]|nr:EAL domain-containing protein [Gammaproteobacteria bacterium]